MSRREGYLLIDHRASGIDGSGKSVRGPEAIVERATCTCSHCHAVVVLNPLRDRPRNYCPKCNHYICDNCEQIRVLDGYSCMPFNERIDVIRNNIILAEQRSR